VVLSSAFSSLIGKTFVPEEDESRFVISYSTRASFNLDYTSGKISQVEDILAKRPDVYSYFVTIGLGDIGQVNAGEILVRLQEKTQRKLSQQEIMGQLRREINQIPGIEAFIAPVSFIGGQRSEPLQFAIRGPDLQKIDRLSDEMVTRLGSIEGMAKVDKDLKLDLPQINLTIDRERAAQLGISAQDVALTLNAMTGGVDIAEF
jgi:HAE1 family hydrophobic/amphiphilic exporter-1